MFGKFLWICRLRVEHGSYGVRQYIVPQVIRRVPEALLNHPHPLLWGEEVHLRQVLEQLLCGRFGAASNGCRDRSPCLLLLLERSRRVGGDATARSRLVPLLKLLLDHSFRLTWLIPQEVNCCQCNNYENEGIITYHPAITCTTKNSSHFTTQWLLPTPIQRQKCPFQRARTLAPILPALPC